MLFRSIKEKLKRKELDCDREIDRILTLDKERRDIIFATEQMKAEQQKASVASAVTHNVAPFLRATHYFGPARQAARTAVAQPRRRGTSLHPFSLGSTHTMTAP